MGDAHVQVGFLTARGVFASYNRYTYFTDISGLEVGDFVVVCVNKLFKIVQVTKTENLTIEERSKATAWIVQKIDVKQYIKQQEERGLA